MIQDTAELAERFWFHLQTAVITYDYLTSLRSVPYGSEEYDFLKSQVGDSTGLPSSETARQGVLPKPLLQNKLSSCQLNNSICLLPNW